MAWSIKKFDRGTYILFTDSDVIAKSLHKVCPTAKFNAIYYVPIERSVVDNVARFKRKPFKAFVFKKNDLESVRSFVRKFPTSKIPL